MKTFDYTTHTKKVLGDLHTPVSIYLKVRDIYPADGALWKVPITTQVKTAFRS